MNPCDRLLNFRSAHERVDFDERREFPQMLTEIGSVNSTLQEFKSALIGIKGFPTLIHDAEQIDFNYARRLAAEVHRGVERPDRLIERMVAEDDHERTEHSLVTAVADPSGEASAAHV